MKFKLEAVCLYLELEKSLSFDEYIASFDAERVEKVRGFVDWLAQYQGSFVHNPWGEVNPDLEIVTRALMQHRCAEIIWSLIYCRA